VREHEVPAGRQSWRRHARLRMLLPVLLVVTAVALAWHAGFVPTRALLADLLADAMRLRESPFAVPACVLAFVVGGILAFPVNLLIAASVVVFGPWLGGGCALAGVLASAATLHAIGRRLPLRWSARLHHPRWRRVRERLLDHGVLAIAFLRLVPVGPYSVISLLAGALHVRSRDYLVGTALGMLPGILVYAAFVDRARAALADPQPRAWLVVAGIIAFAIVLALGLAAWRRRSDGAPE